MTEKEHESDLFGPSLPPGWVESTQACEPTDREAGSGKRSPVSSGESEDDILIGPLPPAEGKEDSKKSAAADIEARAKRMKEKLSGTSETGPVQVEREQWMIELPPTMNRNVLDVKARKFRKHYDGDGDRSAWTETPNQKADKEKDSKSTDFLKDVVGAEKATKRDAEMRQRIEHFNKQHRHESLLEMHQDKSKKAKMSDKEKPAERKPFDRERDLEIRQLKSVDRSKAVQEARGLSNRFSTGQGGSFL
ncbi:GPALPP motifs-containing protein 1-like [Oscarella lobularis]|uniref:GPALPP motifs-containing protein 1-like n=1 Tax=Oscarella lobularis TaxID=121494 RepID=UPI003313695B